MWLLLSYQYHCYPFLVGLEKMKLKCLNKNKSCCCYSLEHGAVIIGITFMVSTSVALLCNIGLLAEWDAIKVNFKDKRMRKFVHPFLIISMVLNGVYLIFSIVLLKGIKKGYKHHVWPWIAWSCIYLSIGIICAIYELTLGAPNGALIEVTLVPVLYLIVFSFWIYCIVCIWNYFKDMTRVKEPFGNGAELDDFDSSTIRSFRDATGARKKYLKSGIWDSPVLSNIRKSASFKQPESSSPDNQYLFSTTV